MGQHIIAVVNNISGLFLRGVGTFAAGAKWTIESVPPSLIEKAKNKETARNDKGHLIPICYFVTSEGNYVGIDDAYIPSFKIGKPPPPPAPVVEFQSKKNRDSSLEPELKEDDENKLESEKENIEDEIGDVDSEEKEEDEESTDGVAIKKKKKKKNRE